MAMKRRIIPMTAAMTAANREVNVEVDVEILKDFMLFEKWLEKERQIQSLTQFTVRLFSWWCSFCWVVDHWRWSRRSQVQWGDCLPLWGFGTIHIVQCPCCSCELNFIESFFYCGLMMRWIRLRFTHSVWFGITCFNNSFPMTAVETQRAQGQNLSKWIQSAMNRHLSFTHFVWGRQGSV